MDTAVTGGLIQARKFRQGNVTRPRFSAGSTKSTGRATCALSRDICAISIRKASGQVSQRVDSGARITADAGAAGMDGTGFGANGAAGTAGTAG